MLTTPGVFLWILREVFEECYFKTTAATLTVLKKGTALSHLCSWSKKENWMFFYAFPITGVPSLLSLLYLLTKFIFSENWSHWSEFMSQ